MLIDNVVRVCCKLFYFLSPLYIYGLNCFSLKFYQILLFLYFEANLKICSSAERFVLLCLLMDFPRYEMSVIHGNMLCSTFCLTSMVTPAPFWLVQHDATFSLRHPAMCFHPIIFDQGWHGAFFSLASFHQSQHDIFSNLMF